MRSADQLTCEYCGRADGHNAICVQNTVAALRAEIARLRAENHDLRRWRALNKPLTAALSIANSHLARLRAEREP